jgi:hypothetical protein
VVKKTIARDRQAKIEEMRRAQAAKERRRTMLVMGAAVLAVVVLVAVVFVVIRNELASQPSNNLADIGVAASAASCDEVTNDPAEGVNNHVGPGTPTPDTTRVEYETAPPSAGPHFAAPEFPANAFYTADDRPPLENLVHNLEHGYTIAWYTEDLPADQVEQLRTIADLARDQDSTGGKFIAVAWDPERGEFPEGKPIALSHWGVDNGHRQYCGAVSGEVVETFITEFPYTDSPEPNAQ